MRILVVDDDPSVRGVARFMLEKAGHEVTEAGGAMAGIKAFRERGADLILCDVFMPERDGLELIMELRREFPTVKIISMSGGGFGGQLDMLPAARKLGADQIIHKPFTQATLLAAMEAAFQPKSEE